MRPAASRAGARIASSWSGVCARAARPSRLTYSSRPNAAERAGRVAAQAVAHGQRQPVADQQGEHAARPGRRGQPGQQRHRIRLVHQHAVAQHRAETGPGQPGRVLARPVHQPDPGGDLRRLRGQRTPELAEQPLRRVKAGHLMAGPGQVQGLGALPAAGVQHPGLPAAQRAAARRAGRAAPPGGRRPAAARGSPASGPRPARMAPGRAPAAGRARRAGYRGGLAWSGSSVSL